MIYNSYSIKDEGSIHSSYSDFFRDADCENLRPWYKKRHYPESLKDLRCILFREHVLAYEYREYNLYFLTQNGVGYIYSAWGVKKNKLTGIRRIWK